MLQYGRRERSRPHVLVVQSNIDGCSICKELRRARGAFAEY